MAMGAFRKPDEVFWGGEPLHLENERASRYSYTLPKFPPC